MKRITAALSATLFTLATLSTTSAAPQADGQQQSAPPPANASISIPGGELIEIRGQMPQKVRLGDSFQYQIEVRNTSNSVMLHNVKLSQDLPEGLTIESSRIVRSDAQAASKEKTKQQQKNQKSGSGKQSWTIKKIGPGESRTVMVTATGDQEGAAALCVTVTSYTPTLCVATEFVKPDLEIVKEAPKKADICHGLEFTYFVKNSGSGAVQEFTVEDELAQGLLTESGDKKLSFTVDGGLEPGETRKFVAQLRAEKTGEFSSRAVVISPDGKKTRSAATKTTVQAAKLDVALDGPATQYINQVSNYTARVTNNGDIVAPAATLAMHFPEDVRLVRIGQPKASDDAVKSDTGKSENQKSKKKQQNKQKKDQKQSRKDSQEQSDRDMYSETILLGDLQPGETVAVEFATIGESAGKQMYKAIAEYECAGEYATEELVTAQAATRTEFIALPALALDVVDNRDPVAVGDELTYTVAVKNEGDAPDSEIKVTAELADGLEFVEASGATEASADGKRISFKPVQSLNPEEIVEWTVRAKVKKESEAMLSAKLTSKHREREATAEEPTRLFKKNSDEPSSDSKQKKDKKEKQSSKSAGDSSKDKPSQEQASEKQKSADDEK